MLSRLVWGRWSQAQLQGSVGRGQSMNPEQARQFIAGSFLPSAVWTGRAVPAHPHDGSVARLDPVFRGWPGALYPAAGQYGPGRHDAVCAQLKACPSRRVNLDKTSDATPRRGAGMSFAYCDFRKHGTRC